MIGELCRQEGIKLFAHKYPYLMIGLVLAVEVAYLVVTALQPPENALRVLTPPQLWAEGVGWGLRLGVYAILVVGAMGISREFSLGTVKTVLVLPVHRYQWVLAKLIALLLFAWGLLLAIVAIGFAIVALTTGWGDVVRAGVQLHSAGAVAGHVAIATLLTAAFLLPVCAFALAVGAQFHSSGAAVGMTLLVGIVLESGAEMADGGKWLFFHHLYRPFAQIVKMGKGLPFQWSDTAAWGLGVGAVSFAILAGWLFLRMERMDITD